MHSLDTMERETGTSADNSFGSEDDLSFLDFLGDSDDLATIKYARGAFPMC